jgi:peptide/nickel transport system substrate-binding protein
MKRAAKQKFHLMSRWCVLGIVMMVSSCVSTNQPIVSVSDETVRIAHADFFSDFNPHQNNITSKNRLGHMYESLVAFDENFLIIPKLAISWGNDNETTWVFTLRKNVFFHDGSVFDSEDVHYSFEHARKSEELSGILSNIKEIVAEDAVVKVTTRIPDPMLLSKLQNVYIVPSGFFESDHFTDNIPNGTGPYRFASFQDNSLKLERFESYWSELPYFREVYIDTVSGRFERANQLIDGHISVLGSVPPLSLEDLKNDPNIRLYEYPSLTIYFLGFNLSPTIKDEPNPVQHKDVRTAIALQLDTQEIIKESNNTLDSAEQLISANIFGFNPDWTTPDMDVDIPEILTKRELKQGFNLFLATTSDLEKSALQFKTRLQDYKIKLVLDIQSPEEMMETIAANEDHMFLLGWKFDTSDSSVFLRDFFHSPSQDGTYGSFNIFHYSNPALDKKIEESETEFDMEARLALLQEIFKDISDDMIAIPLFEPKQLYATRADVIWEPRLDGLILAQDMKK